jgi:hypothetical protein
MLRKNPDAKVLLERMMERSELRISEAAKFEGGYRKQAASRVLESPQTFRQWEGAHSQLLRPIAGELRTNNQVLAVKRMALSMIHRKAPFEYLRDKHVRGADRHRFISVMYGPHDVNQMMVREHHNYLTSACSYLCVDKFCAPATVHFIAEYEKLYTSYWQTRTSYLLETSQSAGHESHFALLQCIRGDLQKARDRVLVGTPSKADALTLEELRRPTGDTVKLQILRKPTLATSLNSNQEWLFPR